MKNESKAITLAAILCGWFHVQAADRQPIPKAYAATSAHQRPIAVLRAERLKWEAGNSTLFTMCNIAKNLRTVELQLSANAAQRIAAHKRHIAVVQDLKGANDKRIEKGVLASMEGKLVADELKEAELELQRAQENK